MIYLLEDDKSIRTFVEYGLSTAGLATKSFERPSQFYKALGEDLPDLVLLDLMLPEEDGLTILQNLRAKSETKDLPIILLTAKDTEYDKVMGLDAGADDYVSKPFGMMELIARIKSLLRRCEKSSKNTVYTISDLSVDCEKRTVSVKGQNVVLTYKEFELLLLLLSHPGKVYTRDQILEHIWGYTFDGENRTVDVHIRTLRTKLLSCGELVETVRGVGYRMGGNES